MSGQYDTEFLWVLINDLADTRDDGTGPSKFAIPRARKFLQWLSANGIERVVDWPAHAIPPREGEPPSPEGPVQGPRQRRTGPTDAAPGASLMTTAMAAVRAKTKDLGDALTEIHDATFGSLSGPADTRVIYERSRAMYDFDEMFAKTCAAMFGVSVKVVVVDSGGSVIEAAGPVDALNATTLLMKLLRQTGWGIMKDRSPSGWKKTELKDGSEFAAECLAEASAIAKRRKHGKA